MLAGSGFAGYRVSSAPVALGVSLMRFVSLDWRSISLSPLVAFAAHESECPASCASAMVFADTYGQFVVVVIPSNVIRYPIKRFHIGGR